MTTAYILSAASFSLISIQRARATEIIVIYGIAYFIAWWMAMIRIRSLHRISFDQARIYDRRVHGQRARLGRNLHDSLGGDLVQLSLLLQNNSAPEVVQELGYEISLKTRNLVETLEPSRDSEDVYAYISTYVDRLRTTGKFRVIADLDPTWRPLRIDQAINLQAIFTEWMTNTIKYSGATEVHVVLRRYGDRFVLVIRDDGVGFRWNGARTGSGLRNIALRAGLMQGRCFSRRTANRGGTVFYLSARAIYD